MIIRGYSYAFELTVIAMVGLQALGHGKPLISSIGDAVKAVHQKESRSIQPGFSLGCFAKVYYT